MCGDWPMGIDFRRARRVDLPEIVRLLADDTLGARRERFETPLPETYLRAFEAIDGDPNQELIVATMDDRVVGTLQLSFLPGLSHQGGWRAQIEAVRVDFALRSQGVGTAMIEHAVARAQERNCRLVQLTTHKTRAAAKRFYEGLGFVASHEGMKLPLA